MRIQKLNYETKTNLLEDLLQRSPNQYTQYESRVLEILEHVKNEKDQAVFDYTKQFDGADITADTITVTKEEIAQAYDLVDESLVEIIRRPLRLLGTNTLDILLWQFVAFRFCVAIQLGLQGLPVTEVFAQESRYYTDNGWWVLYLVIGIVLPLIWGWFLRKGPWGWVLKKLHLV